MEPIRITVQARINAPITAVWSSWTTPGDIVQWNAASDDWHTTRAENDPKTGGRFVSRMEAKDGSMGFDFEGVYDQVIDQELIEYSMPDGRKVRITFEIDGDTTTVIETFDAENAHSVDMQQMGWQAIMDNFKKHTEAKIVK
jgi:uncharacterized protein YndB with AHSA1/START domain